MSLFLHRGAKRWMLGAATGLAVLPMWNALGGEPSLVIPGREPARLALPAPARPLSTSGLRNLLKVSSDDSTNVPIVTADESSNGPTIIRTAETRGADGSGSPDGMSAVERELQKLYERDGRAMPPMRKPIVPQNPASPGVSPGTPATLPQNAAQPIPPKTGVLQKMNPFSRKPAADGSVATTAPQQQQNALPQGAPQNAPSYSKPASNSVEDDFELPARSTAPQAPSRQPSSRDFESDPPSRVPTPPAGDDFNPFPDEPESSADRGFRPTPPQTFAPQSPSAPASTPRFESPEPRQEAAPSEFRAPRANLEPSRIEPPSTRNEEPPRPGGEQNPSTSLKLETNPQATRTAPSFPAGNRTPSSSPTPPDGNPFEAPGGERGPAFNAPATQRFTAAEPETRSAPPSGTPSSSPEIPAPPKLSAPESQPFEAPIRSTTPSLPETQPRLRAPDTADEQQPFAPPSPPSEALAPRSSSSRGTSSPGLTAPAGPRITPDDSRPASRSQPPKPLDPEPAAELPKAQPTPHDRKLRMIAERSGAGFKGFCPVTLRDDRELVDATPEFTSTYEGRSYSFATAAAKRKFDSNPQKYAPVSEGNDVILLGNFGRRVPGSLDYAIWYRDRLHLFSSRETLETFIETLSTGSAPKP